MLMLKRLPLCQYVIEMYEWFDEPECILLVMEYPKPCEALEKFVRKHRKLTESVARSLMHQIYRAVQHCFKRGIVHNDLHSNNILVNKKTLQIKLIDFGCSYEVDERHYLYSVFASTRALGYLLSFMVSGGMYSVTSSLTSGE